ncbi:MAG: His-Xaa-Ser system radical SAM maturase HxsC [Bacteroidales bacterium]|nr:His-Xaa-Ser system radical SAM maturase HxsC [Bacteroidales bacterium]
MRFEWNIESNDNALFVTAQCNNRCIMCCQPPLHQDDIDDLLEKNLKAIDNAPQGIKVVGITGGEPTLLGDKLFILIEKIRSKLPETAIQLLSNGRRFSDSQYAKRMKEVGGDNLFVGIPLHSDYVGDHNLVAGVNGAYDETMLGLYNLNAAGVEIELRVVINSINAYRLPLMSEFIYKNLPFVSWVAYMGMEHTGYAIANEKQIWIEPEEYKDSLGEAVKRLADWGMDVAIFNIPLCLLREDARRFSKHSISDWKVRYADCCNACSLKCECCGLFGTSKKEFNGIKAL